MKYVLGESSSTRLNADRANSCTVPELLHGTDLVQRRVDLQTSKIHNCLPDTNTGRLK